MLQTQVSHPNQLIDSKHLQKISELENSLSLKQWAKRFVSIRRVHSIGINILHKNVIYKVPLLNELVVYRVLYENVLTEDCWG